MFDTQCFLEFDYTKGLILLQDGGQFIQTQINHLAFTTSQRMIYGSQ